MRFTPLTMRLREAVIRWLIQFDRMKKAMVLMRKVREKAQVRGI